ncbi:flavodoxin domain-containing protein [Streptomyces collinus]|uniref:Menaquinone-dependent protoporphyrinogen IX oxidase n=1 Tax=Streptomyces collinus TaxID=42684 RepID=A0AA89Q730_STRCU|nr:flavodoxin domain-containing protein [Streptomyces collinus]MBB5815602.1 menaquinone-dependent protoporphyrinogen IX oxidase [Streptomyces collinus]WMX68507.1 flavodoxin domain-containing protein [Streptomyces collinus]
MPSNVLVAYGTTNGSTAEIAEAVAAVLRKEGVAAEALPARSATSVSPYDAVVVGGGLYAGRWHKDARRFVRRHGRSLAGRPVWFFSSGPLDASASERDIPPVPGVRRAMDKLEASNALLRAATGAGLLVVGHRPAERPTVPRTGPVTHAVIHHVGCPVAVLPHF